MGRYGKALDKLDNGVFVTLTPDQAKRVRILDDPYVQNTSYRDPKTGEFGPPRTSFAWAVWDYEQQKVKILRKGASVLKAIDEIIDAWNIQDMPMACDVVITTTGKGLNTRYSVQGVPLDPSLPYDSRAEMPDMRKYVEGGIPINQFGEGVKPHTKQIDSSSDNDSSVGNDDYVPDQPPIEAYNEAEISAVSEQEQSFEQPTPAAEDPQVSPEVVDMVIEDMKQLGLSSTDQIRLIKEHTGGISIKALKQAKQSQVDALYKALEAYEPKEG